MIYSDFRLFTGLAMAALIVRKLTVISAMASDSRPAIAKTIQLIRTR